MAAKYNLGRDRIERYQSRIHEGEIRIWLHGKSTLLCAWSPGLRAMIHGRETDGWPPPAGLAAGYPTVYENVILGRRMVINQRASTSGDAATGCLLDLQAEAPSVSGLSLRGQAYFLDGNRS